MRNREHTKHRATLLFVEAGAEQETYLGLLIIAAFWALVSAVIVATSAQEERSRRAAWIWASSFASSSLVAAYCFWRLL